MAIHPASPVQNLMEKLVAKPLRATLTVGVSILVLLQILQQLSAVWPEIDYVRFLIPFIPPFFITRTARRVNQRRAEHDFIQDAEPYIFVAFPPALSVPDLLATRPDMISDSSSRHFNWPLEDLLNMEALPARFFIQAEERERLARQLVEDFRRQDGHAVARNFRMTVQAHGQTGVEQFLVNSVLKRKDGRLKWQATLMKLDSAL